MCRTPNGRFATLASRGRWSLMAPKGERFIGRVVELKKMEISSRLLPEMLPDVSSFSSVSGPEGTSPSPTWSRLCLSATQSATS